MCVSCFTQNSTQSSLYSVGLRLQEYEQCVWCSFFFFKQKTADEMRISDWSSDVCSSDLSRRIYVVYTIYIRLDWSTVKRKHRKKAVYRSMRISSAVQPSDFPLCESVRVVSHHAPQGLELQSLLGAGVAAP